MQQANSMIVKGFIEKGATIPLTLTEFGEFWKSSSTDEREQFAREAQALSTPNA